MFIVRGSSREDANQAIRLLDIIQGEEETVLLEEDRRHAERLNEIRAQYTTIRNWIAIMMSGGMTLKAKEPDAKKRGLVLQQAKSNIRELLEAYKSERKKRELAQKTQELEKGRKDPDPNPPNGSPEEADPEAETVVLETAEAE